MVMATIATFFGGLALDLAKAEIGDAIGQRLSGDAIKEALQQAVGVADGEVPELFWPYERQGLRGADRFLNNAFGQTAIAELKKPLQNEGKPDDALLTQVFLREAKSHSKLKDVKENCVAAWMQAFADAYFKTTNQLSQISSCSSAILQAAKVEDGESSFFGDGGGWHGGG